ncbi:MAG: hypothetical protein IPM79_22355 [Polyangiaceae bacterium]|jgi:glutathione peroxidase|nr:hypothetical protein [Polyangiaceae bacterium]MBK8940279.1 hypothetical protein [Polyangiaceae bacterium]
MADLQGLEEQFGAQGFHVLGFYSDDFNQAGSEDDIEACTGQYMVTFPQLMVDHVVDPPVQPVWQWLLAQPNPDPALPMAPDWNFHKYLISRDGQLVGHWDTNIDPGDDPPNNPIVLAIEAELAN